MKALVRRLRRSLAAPLILLVAALAPQLERASPDTFTDAAETLSHFSDGNAIRLLFRPGEVAGPKGFYLVAARRL